MKTKILIADFETTTNPADCRVWGWGCYSNNSEKYYDGETLDQFLKFIRSYDVNSNLKIYFHNLKFDGDFLLYEFFREKFTEVKTPKNNGEFNTLITSMGVWYSISFYDMNRIVTFWDSSKVLPMSVEKIADSFKMEISKLKIDYHKYRSPTHKLTNKERKYIKHDIMIVKKGLDFFFEQDLKKMTIASNALTDFKKTFPHKKYWFDFFPVDIPDESLRHSYKGGYTYLNPKFQEQEIGKGSVYDVNSLYPSVMIDKKYPFGQPVANNGKYKYDGVRDLYITCIRCQFELKKGMLPTIQLKKNFRFSQTEYLKSSNKLLVVLYLTSIDFEIFTKHYDIYNLEYLRTWSFESTDLIFKEYVNKWIDIKNQATIDKNYGKRGVAKLMLNSLYGKFGLSPNLQSKHPVLHDNFIKYELGVEEKQAPFYVPIASFVTAYAREVTITACQDNIERFIYCDTDSMHLTGHEPPKNVIVDPVELGAWDNETNFERAKFLRAKTYIEQENGKLKIACAGMRHDGHKHVTFDNFCYGSEIPDGKKNAKRVPNGVVIVSKPYTINK